MWVPRLSAVQLAAGRALPVFAHVGRISRSGFRRTKHCQEILHVSLRNGPSLGRKFIVERRFRNSPEPVGLCRLRREFGCVRADLLRFAGLSWFYGSRSGADMNRTDGFAARPSKVRQTPSGSRSGAAAPSPLRRQGLAYSGATNRWLPERRRLGSPQTEQVLTFPKPLRFASPHQAPLHRNCAHHHHDQ